MGVEMVRQDVSSTVLQMNNGRSIPVLGLGTWQSGRKTKRAVLSALNEGYRHIDAASVYGNEHYIGEALRQEFQSGTLDRADVFVTSKLWNTDHHRVEQACRESLKRLGLQYLDLYLIHWPMAYKSSSSEAQEKESGKEKEEQVSWQRKRYLKHKAEQDQKDSNYKSNQYNAQKNQKREDTYSYATNNYFPMNMDTGRLEHNNALDFVETWEAMERLVGLGLVKSIGLSNFNQTQIDDILNVANIPPQVLQIEIHP